jgi:hypothetical protein
VRPMSLNESTASSEPLRASVRRRDRVVKLMLSAFVSMSRDFATAPHCEAALTERPRFRFSPAVVFARSCVVVIASFAWAIER